MANNLSSKLKQLEIDLNNIFNECKEDNKGNLADYIPQLSNIDPELFAISITTIDGDEINIGNVDEKFCIQSCCKPLIYDCYTR